MVIVKFFGNYGFFIRSLPPGSPCDEFPTFREAIQDYFLMVKDILIKDYDYYLPDERIARHPLADRDACKLIVSDSDGRISHHIFSELPELISENTLMIANETKVINARMDFHKTTGARIEIFILEPSDPADYAVAFASREACEWTCLVGNRKKWKQGPISKSLEIEGVEGTVTLSAEITGEAPGAACKVRFSWDCPDVTFASIVEAAGNIPIPPYLKRDSETADTNDYQTVFSRVQGSVAAPTAGLHFTPALLSEIREKGVDFRRLILHVGAGTFQPVKSEAIGDHPMHTETFRISRQLVESLKEAISNRKSVLAVGTTSVRTLESLPLLGHALREGDNSLHIGQWTAYDESSNGFATLDALDAILAKMDAENTDSLTASTAIMIAPGFKWRIVDRVITNFHQPQSTLLLLVSSFLNRSGGPQNPEETQWRRIYREASDSGY
ncbi:MAG: S-adenosylmethionine:tRNA ribosyltransferase-isomerase, partial [Muribaculaceae bacterium]|nr:S-adenosylmethionine:tRNA ribosyltransferase-isomerase [Muribaculaceae bacterium]